MKRRADVVGILPNEASIVRPIGAALLEADDGWQLRHRYRRIEGMAGLTPPLLEGQPSATTPQAA